MPVSLHATAAITTPKQSCTSERLSMLPVQCQSRAVYVPTNLHRDLNEASASVNDRGDRGL